MTTAIALSPHERRLINVLNDAAGNVGGVPVEWLLNRSDCGFAALVAPEEMRLLAAVDGRGHDIPISGTPHERIDRIRLTEAGRRWVEGNPTNALLRAAWRARRGSFTIRQALAYAQDTRVIRNVVDEGYVTVHSLPDLFDTGITRRGFPFKAPDEYVLIPTPKIRRVLGDRS